MKMNVFYGVKVCIFPMRIRLDYAYHVWVIVPVYVYSLVQVAINAKGQNYSADTKQTS